MTKKELEKQQLPESAIKPPIKRHFTLALIDENSNIQLKSSNQRIGENILAGTYEFDQTLESVLKLLKQFDAKQFKKLPKIWRNRFNKLSLYGNNFIYIDERLVIPEELRRLQKLTGVILDEMQSYKPSRTSGGHRYMAKSYYSHRNVARAKTQVKIQKH